MVARATVRREQGADGEHVIVSNGRVDARWGQGAELKLFERAGMYTRVTGGPLIELAGNARGLRAFTVGMGADSDEDFAADPTAIEDLHGTGLRARRRFPVAGQPLTVALEITVYDTHPCVLLSMQVANHGMEPLTLSRLFPFVAGRAWGEEALALNGREGDLAAYKQGWQSWSFTGGLPPGASDPRPRTHTGSLWHNPAGHAPREPLGGTADVVSEGMTLVGSAGEQPALLAGFLGAGRHFSQFYVDRQRGSLTAAVLLDGLVLEPGEAVEAEPLLLAMGAPDALLQLYADALARAQGARGGGVSLTGWCSWYHYFAGVSEADIRENLDALRSARGVTPVGVVQIDDGYQRAVGDWTSTNEKFPSGMGALARRIRDAGFRPGLWLAPFTVAAESRLAREHPEWLIRDDQGRPRDVGTNWDTTLHGLDTTHPGAREWLRRLFGTLVEEWGYDYLKLDFLVTGAMAGHRWAAGTTGAEALRNGLELIRSVVGGNVYLLGCGCPWLSGVGIFDAMRIGPDVAPYWSPRLGLISLSLADTQTLPNTEGAVRNTLLRAWMHPTLWVNDPDCLLACEAGTELTAHEVRALASAIGLTGGMVLLSDRVSRLTLERLDLVARLLPPLRERAVPTSYLEPGIPEQVTVRLSRPWGSWLLVGLFNAAPDTREMRVAWDALGLEAGLYHATEFWSGSYLGASPDGAAVPVPGHGAAVLAVRAVLREPQLLSTSFHFSQGGAEIAAWDYEPEAARVRWVAALGRRAAGTFTLWLPAELVPARLVCTARAAHWHRRNGDQVVIEAEIEDRAEFVLELQRGG
jgi:alpha-galactosidase